MKTFDLNDSTYNPSGTSTDYGGLQKCSYCGNYHTYSAQMCRDMVVSRKDETPNVEIRIFPQK